jgi:excisionase family DNA binding protein
MSMSDEILNKDQVAHLLDCEPSTVEEKARNHELPAVKIGRSWLFPRQALMQRLNEMALASPTPARPQGIIKANSKKRSPPALPPLPPLPT